MGVCLVCAGPLTGRQRRYCSDECRRWYARDQWLRRTYGITAAEYDRILRAQRGGCGVCRRPPRPGEQFHVDHEHREGQSGPVRGILCPYCNTRLVGRLRDHERAQALADYLRDPPAPRALGRTVVAPGRKRTRRRRKR